MDYRRMRLISWRHGYDFRDHAPASYRKVTARRVRKQERAMLEREVERERQYFN